MAASAAAERLTPQQAFSIECQKDVKYLGLSDNQQLRPSMGAISYTEEVAYCMIHRVHRRNFTSPRGTFSMVNPDKDACMNVSVFMWFIEMARRTGIDPIIETVLNESSRNMEAKQVEWYGVIVAVPPHKTKDWDDHVQAHLTGKAIQQEEEGPPRRGRPSKKAKKENPDLPGPNTHRASWRRVRNVKDLLDTIHRANMCEDDHIVHRINFDVDSTEIEATDAPEGINTIPTLFDLEATMAREIQQEQFAETNTPMATRQAESYVANLEGRKHLRIHPSMYDMAPWTLRRINVADRCINPDPDSLFDYLLPNNDVTLKLLCERFTNVGKFNGRKRAFSKMSQDEIRAQFVGPTAKYSKYSHTVDVKTKNPLGVQKGITYSQQWKQKLYPVQSFIEEDCRTMRQVTIHAYKNGDVGKTEVFNAHNVVADIVEGELETETLGTVPYYREVYKDFKRLNEEINEDNPVANMARKLLYYKESSDAKARDIPDYDAGLLSFSDAITNHHNVTPQQLSVIMKLIIMMFGSARHEFIPVVAVALFGKSDVGKTYCIKKLTSLLPPSMQEAENDSSEKAWVLDGGCPFKFVWMDEIGTGLSDNGKGGKSRDSKNMQAGMSNAVASYKQYNRGSQEGGVGDTLRRIDVDCRKTYAITSNRLLNDAMMSRVDPIPTYEDPKNMRGRSKLEKASCDSNSVAAQATSLMVQFVMTGALFVWAFHAAGGFIRDIDESLFEVFVGMQSAVMGREQMKCRKVDRLKQHSISLMVFGFVNDVMRKRENREILNDMHRLTAMIIARCSVVSLRHVEIAFSLSRPTAQFTEATTRCLIAIKKLVTHDFRANQEPLQDSTCAYYATDVQKLTAGQRLYQASEMMGNETNLDVLQSALTQLECTSNKGLCTVKYDLAGDKLHIIQSSVDDSRILTDIEVGVVEWLVKIFKSRPHGDLWRYDFNEKHVLFKNTVAKALTNSQGEICNDATIRELSDMLDYDQNVRARAMVWLKRAAIRDQDGETQEYVCSMAGALDESYSGMQLFECDDVHSFGSEDTREDGPVPGKKKKRICMAGSIRVPLAFLTGFMNVNDRATAALRASEEFSNVLHACSGEVKRGKRIFRIFSTETDHEVSSARTSRVGRPTKKSVTYRNPRVMAKSDIYDPKVFFEYDTLHREDQLEITVKEGDDIYRKRVEQRVLENTGVSLQDWERHYGLPPMFGERYEIVDSSSDESDAHGNEEAISAMIRLAEEAEKEDSDSDDESRGAVAPPRD